MLHITDYRRLTNGKRYQTSDEREMSHHGGFEEITNRNSSENVDGEVPEIQTLTQEAVNELIRRFIAPLRRQLEELTRLVQGMSTQDIRIPNPRLSVVPLLVRPGLSPTTAFKTTGYII